MAEFQKHEPNSFCWIELGTTDAEGAKKFYTELFNWGIDSVPMGEGGTYYMFTKNGKEVAAMYQLKAEQTEMNVPPHWMPYINVENVDLVAEKARASGGTLLSPPFDVHDSGRMTFIKDPVGAEIGLWQANKHIGTKFKNEDNSLCWVELATKDTDKSAKFYSDIVGWDVNTTNFGDLTYHTFKNGPISEAGMYKMPPEIDHLPPHWLTYIHVADCDETVAKAKELGAQVMKEPEFIPTVGKFSVLKDPQGGVFAVIKLDM